MGLLLSAAQRFVTPQLIGRMATALGIDPKLAESAASAGIPAILAGLSQIAGSTSGTQRLAGATAKVPAGMLDDIGSRLSNPDGIIEQGQSLLSSLFGSGASNMLMSSLARYVGSTEGSMRSLVGLLVPVIMGVLGRHQQTMGGDASGLAQQLRSEASDFKAAMPSGLSSMLDSSGFFDQVGAPQAAAAGSGATREDFREGTAGERAARPTPTPTPRAQPARSDWSWAYWALPLAALIGGLIGYMLGGDQRVGDMTTALRTPDISNARPMNSYMRQPVFSQAGEPLGTVEDILIARDGQVMAVLSTAQPLGLGEKRIAVPMPNIEIATRDGSTQLVFKGSRDTLADFPAVDGTTGSSGVTGVAPTPPSTPGTTTTQPQQ